MDSFHAVLLSLLVATWAWAIAMTVLWDKERKQEGVAPQRNFHSAAAAPQAQVGTQNSPLTYPK